MVEPNAQKIEVLHKNGSLLEDSNIEWLIEWSYCWTVRETTIVEFQTW